MRSATRTNSRNWLGSSVELDAATRRPRTGRRRRRHRSRSRRHRRPSRRTGRVALVERRRRAVVGRTPPRRTRRAHPAADHRDDPAPSAPPDVVRGRTWPVARAAGRPPRRGCGATSAPPRSHERADRRRNGARRARRPDAPRRAGRRRRPVRARPPRPTSPPSCPSPARRSPSTSACSPNAGLVTSVRQGREARYRVVAGSLRPASDWIQRTEASWSRRVDRLQQHLADR